MEIDPVWTVCDLCGALVGRAGLHAAWHNPPTAEPELEPEPEPDPDSEIESENE